MCDVLQGLPIAERPDFGLEALSIKVFGSKAVVTCCSQPAEILLSDLTLINVLGDKFTGYRSRPGGVTFNCANEVVQATCERCGRTTSVNLNLLLFEVGPLASVASSSPQST